MSGQTTIEPDTDAARRAALSLLDYYGIEKPGEIDLESIAWAQGIDIRESRLKSSEAQLIRKANTGVIRVRPGEKDTPRGRFSIGHELGHWQLHPDQSQFWICTAEQIHRYKGNWMEIEANAFASELLMPTPLFRPYCQRVAFGCILADRLSKMFGTSLQATALRMVDETPEPAIVVLSDGERVTWSKRNRALLPDFGFHIPRDQELHPESRAWGASIDGDSAGDVDPEAWFPNLQQRYRLQVHEETRYVESYGVTLSLIVVHED